MKIEAWVQLCLTTETSCQLGVQPSLAQSTCGCIFGTFRFFCLYCALMCDGSLQFITNCPFEEFHTLWCTLIMLQ